MVAFSTISPASSHADVEWRVFSFTGLERVSEKESLLGSQTEAPPLSLLIDSSPREKSLAFRIPVSGSPNPAFAL